MERSSPGILSAYDDGGAPGGDAAVVVEQVG
jgi:hypothetical protein